MEDLILNSSHTFIRFRACMYNYIVESGLDQPFIDGGDEAFIGYTSAFTNIYNESLIRQKFRDQPLALWEIYRAMLRGQIILARIRNGVDFDRFNNLQYYTYNYVTNTTNTHLHDRGQFWED